MINKLKEMFEMQKVLDNAIYKENNTKFDEYKCRIAVLDEVGELIHELKGNWCWWKKTQKPVDRDKVLEELVDVYHFVLSYEYNANDSYFACNTVNYDTGYEAWVQGLSNDLCLIYAVLAQRPRIEAMVVLTRQLGFTFDDVYNAYIKKNATNFERLANGY